jgi:hypothetical protein
VAIANQALLVPLRLAANVGLATADIAAAGASRAANLAAGVLSLSLLPLSPVADLVKRTSDSMLGQHRNGGKTTSTGSSPVSHHATVGHVQPPAKQRLGGAVLTLATRAAELPIPAATAAIEAAYQNPVVRQTFDSAVLLLSSSLDRYSRRSIFPDSIVRTRNATFRKAALQALLGGPFPAVLQDFKGMVGGLTSLFLGDPHTLAQGSRAFKRSMDYVYEKWLHGEIQPDSDFPLKAELAEAAVTVVQRFPKQFVEALDRGDLGEIGNAYLAQMGDVNAFVLNYPKAAYHVLTGASKFILEIFVQVEDGYAYPLNELAIFDSRLSDEEKDWAHEALRKTAPKPIVDFEYYIPLLVDAKGNLAEKHYRRNAAGDIINDRLGTPSIFPTQSIELAQSIHAELSSLPSLIWLYGDVKKAREKNLEETTRKFGPIAAKRIAERPMFPLSSAEIDELTGSGPRTHQQIEDTLDSVMRLRGLVAIAEGIKRGSLAPLAVPELAKRRKA